ncbi:MAG: hypothetical protein RJA98_472 [Pseudomonadota bacterium]|jgi:two-component system sensor histidine kinase BarA
MNRLFSNALHTVQHMPLRRRLSWLVAFAAGLTALLSMLAALGLGISVVAGNANNDTQELALSLVAELQPALVANDRATIARTLAHLQSRPRISGAWVYDAQGQLLSTYGTAPAEAPGQGSHFDAGRVHTTEPIELDGQRLGQLVLLNDYSDRWTSLLLVMLTAFGAAAAGFVLSVLTARRMAQRIAEPMVRLAHTSSEIARRHDYQRRLPAGGSDEVGTAVNAFNNMLDVIAQRGDALQEANRSLEQRIQERTLALLQEKERAEGASQAKTRFLANMSHELRSPLNGVIGAAQLLKSGTADAEQQSQLIDSIRHSGDSLLSLIENILDLSRTETGDLQLFPEDFHLLDCIESALATVAVPARAKGLQLACIIDPSLPMWRRGDALRLRQAVLNLLGNAVKFTLAGEVVMRVQPGQVPGWVRITVTDTGVGIPAAALGQVFEPFAQADDGANRRFGGGGLGLSITRQWVEAMGGRIGVQSQEGRGASFAISVPLPPAQAVAAPQPPLRKHVLYVEPHDASAEALGALLRKLGCDAQRCRSAADIQTWISDHGPAADPWVLVAVDAPESWALVEHALPFIQPERVIGMSLTESHGNELTRERFKLPRHISKPVLRSTLVSRLGAVEPLLPAGSAPLPGGDPSAAPPSSSATGPGLPHVLVVEDDRLNQTIVCSMLHSAGYQTTVADDGAQALALVAAQPFDLVLMDWQMPDMDGLEVTRRLRAGASGAQGTSVPIVAVTANAFAEDRAACLAAGMNDFLTKPVLTAHLLATVAQWVLRPAAAPAAVSPQAPAA